MRNPFKEKKKKPVSLEEVLGKLEFVEGQISKLSGEFASARQQLSEAFQKIGVVRYNPFRELGGDQSFSITFLNEKNDGFVLTSHFGRDMQRLYAKTVKGGKSEHTLSEEEQESIGLAINNKSNGQSETAEKRK